MRSRRGPSRRGRWTALVAVFVILISSVAVPSGSVTTGTMERDSTVDVVDDPNAIIGLEKYSPLNVGSLNDLVTVTNNVNPDLKTTVSIDSTFADRVDVLVNGSRHDQSATFTLNAGANETVSADLNADCSLDGKQLPYTVDGNTTAFDGTIERSVPMKAPNVSREHIVFENSSNNNLSMINRSSKVVTEFNITTSGFGPPAADYDCDGRMEIPYVTPNGALEILDHNSNQHQILPDNNVRTGTRLAVMNLTDNDKPTILYSNASDGNTLYGVSQGESPKQIANISVHSLANPTDFNGDGAFDYIFTDSNSNMKFYNGTVHTIDVSDTNDGLSQPNYIGDPHNFSNGRNTVDLPYIHNGNLYVANHTGDESSIMSPQGGDKFYGSLGTFNWNTSNGVVDLILVEDNGKMKYYKFEKSSGESALARIKDENDNDVEANGDGAA